MRERAQVKDPIILLGCELVVSVATHGQHGSSHSVEYHSVHRDSDRVLGDDVLGWDVVNTSPRKWEWQLAIVISLISDEGL